MFSQRDLGRTDKVAKLLQNLFQSKDAAPNSLGQDSKLRAPILRLRHEILKLVQIAFDGKSPIANHVRRFGGQLPPGRHALRIDQAVQNPAVFNGGSELRSDGQQDALVVFREFAPEPWGHALAAQNAQDAQNAAAPEDWDGQKSPDVRSWELLKAAFPARIFARAADADRFSVLRDPPRQTFAQGIGRFADPADQRTPCGLENQLLPVPVEYKQRTILEPQLRGGDIHDPAHQQIGIGDRGEVFADLDQRGLPGTVAVHEKAQRSDICEGLYQREMRVVKMVRLEALNIDDPKRMPVAVQKRHGDFTVHIIEERIVVRVSVDIPGDVR